MWFVTGTQDYKPKMLFLVHKFRSSYARVSSQIKGKETFLNLHSSFTRSVSFLFLFCKTAWSGDSMTELQIKYNSLSF